MEEDRGGESGEGVRDLAVDARGVDRLRLREEQDAPRLISYEKGINTKKSGDEFYYTACSSLIVSKNSCNNLQCQILLI